MGCLPAELASCHGALETESTGGHVVARRVQRVGRHVEADRIEAGDRAHLRDAASHHACAEDADAFHDSGRSIRASQSPGAASSECVGTISSRVQRRFS